MIQYSVSIPEKMYKEVKALRRKLILHSNNNVSQAAVTRLLIHLGLKAIRGMDVETILEMARREGLL